MNWFPVTKWRACNVVILDRRLKASSKLVFVRLMDHHNHKTKQCNPSQKTLGESLGMSDRTIRSCLRELEKFGYIGSKQNFKNSNSYSLKIPTGKFEYEQAVNSRQRHRTPGSDKPKNKPHKEPKRSPETSSGALLSRSKLRGSDRSIAEKMAKFEGDLVATWGGGASAYCKVLAIDDHVLTTIQDQFFEGQITMAEAIKKLRQS